MVSAPAIANRAETPERWSTELDSRSARVNRARISTRWSGTGADEVGLLQDHRHLVLELDRVVRADLGAEAVLERRDDPAAVGVVLGVRAGDHEGVQRQPEHVAADLDVALLHHVEHRHLDPLGQVGQLVDRDDAPVGAGDQAEVDGLGVAEAAPLGHLHRVDVTDQVGHARVGRGQLLGVPVVAVAPVDPEVVALLDGAALRGVRDRLVGVLPQLGAGDHRRPLVEQPDQGAQQSRLALSALTQQHHVVAGEQRPLELRDDGGLEPVQPGPRIATLTQGVEQVVAQLLAERLQLVAAGAQLAESVDGRCVRRHSLHATHPLQRPGFVLRR